MNYTLVALVLILMFLLCGSREGFVDFGFSGYKKPVTNFRVSDGDAVDLSEYKRDETLLTSDEISSMIGAIQERTKTDTGECLQPVQTIYINKYTGPQGNMYDSRIMFFDPAHQFVTELSSQLLKNTGNSFSILSIKTPQEISDKNAFKGGSIANFLPETDLQTAIAPTKGLLDNVVKA